MSKIQLKYPFLNYELILLIGLLIVYLLVNFLTGSQFPTVNLDEVMFADPAANLYFGKGFTSSAWFTQSSNEFWAGNMPLYSIFLYNWIKVFGFSLLAVRSLNYILMTMGGLILWLAVLRLNLVKTGWGRISLVALFLCSYGISWCARSGRYDCLGIVLFLSALLSQSIPIVWCRYLVLFSLVVLLPITGLHLVPYTILLSILLLIFLKKAFLKEALVIGIGLLFGGLLIYIFYTSNGAFDDFVNSVRTFSNRSGSLINFKNVTKDASLAMLLMGATSIAIYKYVKKETLNPVFWFGLVGGFVISIFMLVLGRFPTNYSWMAYIPLTIGFCSALPELKRNLWQRWVAAFLVVICCFGMPLWVVLSIYEAADRDYTKVENLVAKVVQKTDWVYANSNTFYAIKNKSEAVFFDAYISVLQKKPEEAEKINLLIVNPYIMTIVKKALGDNWQETGDEIIPTNRNFLGLESSFIFNRYYLKAYRKKDNIS